MRLQETFAIWHQPEGVRGARDAVRIRLASWNVPVDRDLVVLLVSEAVSNAVEHGGPPSSVCLAWDATTFRVDVRDTGVDPLPVVRPVDPHAEAGRGLAIVAALADRWGVDVGTTSKTVWFEVGNHDHDDLDDGVPAIAEAIAFEAARYLRLRNDEVEPV